MLFALSALLFLMQLALFAALHLRGSYNPVAHAVSDYGVGPTRQLFTIYGLFGTAGVALLAAGLWADGGFPSRAILYLLAMAALRLGVLAFPTDLEGESLTRTGKLHYLFAIASFALAYMAIDVLQPLLPSPVLRALWWSATISLALVVLCLIPALRRVFGLVERVFLLSILLWMLVFSAIMALPHGAGGHLLGGALEVQLGPGKPTDCVIPWDET